MGNWRNLVAVLGLVVLAGCSVRAPELPPSPISAGKQCLANLAAAKVVFEPLEAAGSGACTIDNPVRLVATGVPFNRPGMMSCELADALRRFEAEIVQPAAQRHFRQGVRRIHHAGSFDCRSQRNRNRLSQHALGKAMDIVAFELADGGMVNVAKHWSQGGARAAFLQEVARRSCSQFAGVITPDGDADHRDHIHLDIGPYTFCR